MAEAKDWIASIADDVEARVNREKGTDATIVCASGISPSGNIHLGNFREIMTVHLIAEELKRRGRKVDHLHSWDDFDRLRKVPGGIADSFAANIGRPLSDIPDPFGEFDSYASRYIAEFERTVEKVGIQPRYIRQSGAYRSGIYTEKIKIAMQKRLEIFDILAEYQTLEQEKSAEERREEYYPLRVYCDRCDTDLTKITYYDENAAFVQYGCENCGHSGLMDLNTSPNGKLVWKVDWPMRWSFEQVDYEPAGEDHAAPGSSYMVGERIIREVYGDKAPNFTGYAFVGIAGRSKISSSAGTNATPQLALNILEPAILRWLYIRRSPDQKFNIDFGKEVIRIYDEWDSFVNKVRDGNCTQVEKRTFERCSQTSSGAVQMSGLPVSFRLLSSAADITQGNVDQILRIVSEHLDLPAETLQDQLEPRLSCAIQWATEYLPEDERTVIRADFSAETYAQLSERNKKGIELLLERLEAHWSLDGLTKLVYGIPKLIIGFPLDAPPGPEVKAAQRDFFIALYRLICNSDTGPRLPTLFLSIGKERLIRLLSST